MGSERERAVDRICLALGCGRRESRALARRCAVTMGAYLADAVRLEVWSSTDLRQVIRLEGVDHLRDALSRDRGAFVLSAHIGNWEILAAAIAEASIPFCVVAGRPHDPVLACRLEALRRRWGIESLWRDDGPRPVLRALDAGRAVGVLIDQATGSGADVPFFGLPAHTPTGPARIAIRLGVPVVPVHCEDRPGARYVGIFEPPLVGEGEQLVEPLALTAFWTRHVEGWVRAAPHTWAWMHDRWQRIGQRTAARREVGYVSEQGIPA